MLQYLSPGVTHVVVVSFQIVVCQNTSKNQSTCCSVIGHELVHMFDFCRAKVDFTNIEHLACTEVSPKLF